MSSLHHVELCTGNLPRLLRLFTKGLGFRSLGRRVTPRCLQWVLNSGRSTFVLTQRQTAASQSQADCVQLPGSPPDVRYVAGEPWTQLCCWGGHQRDSVFNVALCVRDVGSVTERARRAGARLLQPPVEVSDPSGHVQYSVIGSVCGNVVHTLINRERYSGEFLPQFINQPDSSAPGGQETDYVDHVTLTCRRGESQALIAWYEHVFGMSRFKLNSLDTPEDGVRFDDEVGMSLKAMEYWRCAETGLSSPPVSQHDPTLKLVVAESLHERSHVETFLREHGGPGVQHIGLHTDRIVSCVARMARDGVRFRKPPPAYYSQAGKRDEISGAGIAGEELARFQRLGLLLDSEADRDAEHGDRYLMQVFTEPLFDEDTFFMEVLERRGARGFGQGNITALARSIVEDQRARGTG